MFVGPTSQAPRIDEARNDQVYELELAFKQIPDRGEFAALAGGPRLSQPAVDATGNTHRANSASTSCSAPETATRPLGAARDARVRDAAARADEPDAAIAAAGADRPVLANALSSGRWCAGGPKIHDRFLLPHFVQPGFGRRGRST